MAVSAVIDNVASHPILSTAARVAAKSKHVRLNKDALDDISKTLSRPELDNAPHHWLSSAPEPAKIYFDSLSLDQRILFLVVFHTIGFCYWGDPKWRIFSPTADTTFNGARALLISLSAEPNFLNLSHLSELTELQFKAMLAGFKSQNIDSLLLMSERHSFLSALATRLGKDKNFLKELIDPNQNALNAALAISQQLPGYRDVAEYAGEPVIFLKKAQLLVADINHALVRSGNAGFSCMHELTGFADYKLPQLLRHQGIIDYDNMLTEKIDQGRELTPGSEEEIEIRAATLIAIEYIKRSLAKVNILTTAAEIDAKLWMLAQDLNPAEVKPYHRCRTVFY